jgi:hypothetical protein
MANQVEGNVIETINESGISAAGKAWEKQTVVIRTEGQYPDDIAVTFMGEKVLPVAKTLKEGDKVVLHINVSSKKSATNGKYFNNINGWKIDKVGGATASNAVLNNPSNDSSDDLPFN